MNALFIISNFAFPGRDGKQRQAFQLIKQVCAAGNKGCLIATARPGVAVDAAALQAQIPNLVSVSVATVRYSYKVEGLLRIGSSLFHPIYQSRLARTIRAAIGHFRPDVAYCEGVTLAPLLKVMGPVPCFFSFVDVYSLRFWRFFRYEKRLGRKLASLAGWFIACLLENCAFKRARQIHAVSEGDKQALLARAPGIRVRVIPLALTVSDRELPSAAPGEPRLLLMGDLSVNYLRDGVLWFLEKVWPCIKEKVPAVSAWIVGGRLPADGRLMAKLAATQDVWLTSRVGDLDQAITTSSVICLTDQMGTGMKNRLLNAMGLGKPVVGTHFGFESVPVAHGCHGFIADTPQAFAEACCRLLSDAGLGRKIGAAGRELVLQQYDPVAVGALWLSALNEVATSA